MFTGLYSQQTLKVGNLRMYLSRSDLTVRDGTGKPTGVSLGTPLWMAECEINALNDDESVEVETLIDSAKGSAEQFIVTDPRRWYPKAYPLGTGADLAPSSFSLDATRTILTLNGINAGQVVSRGDYVGFKGGSGLTKRHMVRVMQTVTANGSGVAVVTVNPAVWPVVSTWASVVAHLDKPSVSMKLVAGTEIGPTAPNGMSTTRLVAMQYLWD